MERLKKILLPLLFVALIGFSWFGPLDSLATEQVDAGFKRALITFATARTLNAVISVAQGTQLAIEPAGVGVNLAPGQLLDPINDLVEQFSTLMLLACVSFGVQKALIAMGGHWLVSVFLTAALLLWSAFRLSRQAVPIWVSRLALFAIVLRLALPLTSVGADRLFEHFLAEDYAASQSVIESGAGTVRGLDESPPAENRSLIDKLKDWTPQHLDIGARIDRFVQAAEQWPEKMIRLIVVFLLQTLLLPLLLLWALVFFSRALLYGGLPARREGGDREA